VWWQRVITVILTGIILLDTSADLGDCKSCDSTLTQTR
jgi:hypothetical protein